MMSMGRFWAVVGEGVVHSKGSVEEEHVEVMVGWSSSGGE